MHVLALDTTTRAGSVAIVGDDRVLFEKSGDPSRSHAERLPEDVLSALADSGLSTGAIDVFAVASGPGSFTGLRIGIATIQGLAVVHRKRVVPVSALRALAQAGAATLAEGAIVGAWMDAHRRDVFGALYRVSRAGLFDVERLAELDPPSVDTPVATLSRWIDSGHQPSHIVGDGAVKYCESLKDRVQVVPPPPLAGVIGRIAHRLARDGASVDPAALRPLYIRRPDAEIARDARSQGDR